MSASTKASVSPTAAEGEVLGKMRAQDLAAYRWSNAPFDTYEPHSHPYHKVLYCLRGSIRFVMTREGKSVELQAGDQMDLEPDTEHSAFVGPHGVDCLEAQR